MKEKTSKSPTEAWAQLVSTPISCSLHRVPIPVLSSPGPGSKRRAGLVGQSGSRATPTQKDFLLWSEIQRKHLFLMSSFASLCNSRPGPRRPGNPH